MAKQFYLTDAKSWVDYWDGKRYEPVSEKQTVKLLEAIKEQRISIHWRSERVAEFVIDDPEHDITEEMDEQPWPAMMDFDW